MIRRHFTPALIAFVALLISILAVPLVGRSWWLAAGFSLLCAAAAAPLLAGRVSRVTGVGRGEAGAASRRLRVGILLLSASGGLLLGALSLARISGTADRATLGMRETDVTDVSVTVVQDSNLSRAGDTVLRAATVEASSARRGIAARARGSLLLFVTGDYRFSIGQRLLVHAPVSRLPGFDPEQWVARARRADVSSGGFTSPVWSFRAGAREWLHRTVSRTGYPSSALLEALLIGAREDVPADLYDGFMRTGSLHILALSGLHVTVLYGVVAGLLWFLGNRWRKFLVAVLVLLFYQFLAGFMPSLLRATVMIVLGGIAALLDRDPEPLNVLALSGIVLLLIDPFQAFTLSFQLSFLALAGILVIGALLQRPLAANVPRFLLLAFTMSAGAQVATLPLVIARFGTYYPSGLVASLLLVPLTTGYLWAGLAWIPLSLVPWPALHDLCAQVFAVFYQVIRLCADAFSRLPGFTFTPDLVPWLSAAAGLVAILAATVLPLKGGMKHGARRGLKRGAA
jgi:competence protein ComEC